MYDVIQLLALNFVLIMACMGLLWPVSIPLRDVSFVDSFWAAGFVLIAGCSYYLTGGGTDRRLMLLTITAVWGARLAVYLFLRWRREGPTAVTWRCSLARPEMCTCTASRKCS